MKRVLKTTILALLLLLMCGCGKNNTAEVPDTNGDGKLTCTLEIRCDVLLNHLDQMTKEKAALVPENGTLLAVTEVEFTGGESVFDVFRKVLREEKLHFEYVDASAYDSVYIEGIGNLYEYDCGPQSGWMYSVNGVFPGLGCSAYTLADGDVIVFRYTCDLGADLGAENFNEYRCFFRISPRSESGVLCGNPRNDHVYTATGVPADLHGQRVRLLALFAGKKGDAASGGLFAPAAGDDGAHEPDVQS